MAGTFTVNDDGTVTVAFAYTASQEKVSSTVNDAVAQLYEAGGFDTPIEFGDLTNQQKLDVLDAFVKRIIRNNADRYNLKNALDATRIDAIADSDAKYI